MNESSVCVADKLHHFQMRAVFIVCHNRKVNLQCFQQSAIKQKAGQSFRVWWNDVWTGSIVYECTLDVEILHKILLFTVNVCLYVCVHSFCTWNLFVVCNFNFICQESERYIEVAIG